MKKPRKAYADRSVWSSDQVAIVERYMDEADRTRTIARWERHEAEIGHPVSSIRSMATHIRERRRAANERRMRQNLRALADAPPSYGPKPVIRVAPPKPVYRGKLPAERPASKFDIDSHRIATTTAALRLDAEIRDRIADRGLTAGWFGDPPPGRSALDEIRAGIIRPTPGVRGAHVPKKPTLATKITL